MAAAVIAAATVAVYGHTIGVPFLLDDPHAVALNLSIRKWWDVAAVFWPPETATTAGRPLLNATFAGNYAAGGLHVAGYHAVNLLIHILSAWLLFGLVRRLADRAGARHATGLAFTCALIWAVHPLQTEAVTYISQRAESLMGLWYLLTLYAFVRGWKAISVIACFCGMATKEPMATAPVIVLLLDRTFYSASIREAWSKRRGYYLALAGSWLLLAVLVSGARTLDQSSVGFHTGVRIEAYTLTELKALVLYLKLSLWPTGLVFDYGSDAYLGSLRSALPFAMVVAGVLVVTALAWRRFPIVGFLLTAFFVLLAPTSSVVPIAYQPIAESRMYLPLACVVVLAITAFYAVGGVRSLVLLSGVGALLAFVSFQRNSDYQTAVKIWADTVAKAPDSSRAHYSLGQALAHDSGQEPQAMAEYKKAVAIDPSYSDAYCALADLVATLPGRRADAIGLYQTALSNNPASVVAHNNLANELAKVAGRTHEAIQHYQEAIQLDQAYAKAHYNLGNLYLKQTGQRSEAIAEFQAAIRIDPAYTLAYNNLAIAYSEESRIAEALSAWQTALRIDPECAPARSNLARFQPQR